MDENNLKLETLLNKIEGLKKNFSKQDEFNAYHIFRLKDKEVMHSRFIKSLLNPNENHGFKDDFLKLFLKKINVENFNTDLVMTECEKNTHNNRYIDIAIENKTSRQMIIIENKIRAGDLDNQLLDYYKYGMELYDKKSENIFIIYLTPYGKLYGNNSFPKEHEQPKNKIKCISYEIHILEWLNECLELIGNTEKRIYVCIEMYIELIRKTINRDKYMEKILEYLAENSSQMAVAIDTVKAIQGRNFLANNSPTRKKLILANLEVALEDKPVREEGDDQDVFYIDVELNITVDSSLIYGEKKGIKDTKNNDLRIIGNDLNNKYLVALLTNDTDLILEWIKKTIDYLEGDAENLSE